MSMEIAKATHKHRYWLILLCLVLGLGATFLLTQTIPPAQASTPPAPTDLPASQRSEAANASGTYTLYLPFVGLGSWQPPPFGVQFYNSLHPSQGLTQVAAAGTVWIRLPVHWEYIEPEDTTPEYYNWSSIDTPVANAQAEHVQLILTISGQPPWAADFPMGPLKPDMESEFFEFMSALVERYDGDGIDDAPGSPWVRYFELYNEPDNTDPNTAAEGWGGYWGHNGAGYAALAQQLYPVVKAANPEAKLIMGGLALDWFEKDGGPFDQYFLDDVMAACEGKQCFDMANFHYYPVFYTVWAPYGKGIIGKATYVRQILTAYGQADMPVICTEMSWASNAVWGNQELQSRYAVKGFARGMAADLPIVIWFMVNDAGIEDNYGLLDAAYAPKSSYYAYQTMTSMLHRATYQRTLTLAETGSNQIEGYVFDVGGQRLDIVWTNDSTPFNADDDPELPFSANASTLWVSDKFGSRVLLDDAHDGVIDGKVTLLVGGSPLFLEYNP